MKIWKPSLPVLLGIALVLIVAAAHHVQGKREREICGQLAQDVAAGTLPLDRYMATRCKAALLSADILP